METTSEFDGSMAALILAVLICFPAGIYYYFTNKEEMWVCPECRGSVRIGAGTCPHCGEDLRSHTTGDETGDLEEDEA
ncbi:heavy metal-binding domain-containing protein [Haloarchaeobius sp. HRN-SO-5]|uniref:heavy metal-binding domain-containing protein n=1 Tax=Haloarchaeobius sp. HRN-SO-5 TaxID=3446118 RepID=UPI003EB7FC12